MVGGQGGDRRLAVVEVAEAMGVVVVEVVVMVAAGVV